MFDAWNNGNVERMIEVWWDDSSWEEAVEVPDRRMIRGRENVEARLREVIEVIGEMRLEVVDLEDLGGETLASVQTRVVGSASAVSLDAMGYHLIRFEGGAGPPVPHLHDVASRRWGLWIAARAHCFERSSNRGRSHQSESPPEPRSVEGQPLLHVVPENPEQALPELCEGRRRNIVSTPLPLPRTRIDPIASTRSPRSRTSVYSGRNKARDCAVSAIKLTS